MFEQHTPETFNTSDGAAFLSCKYKSCVEVKGLSCLNFVTIFPGETCSLNMKEHA